MGKPWLPGWHFCGGGGNDFAAMGNFSISSVPEPSSLTLLASGLVGGLAAPSPQRFDKQVPFTRSFILAVVAGILVRPGTARLIREG
jgi:hypothetical protein